MKNQKKLLDIIKKIAAAERTKTGTITSVSIPFFDIDNELDEFERLSCLGKRNAIKEIGDSLTKIRGVERYIIYEGYWGDLLVLVGKPCKEFDRLNNRIEKLAGRRLDQYNIYTAGVSGKRSRYDYDYVEYFMHNQSKCAQIIEWLRKNLSQGNKLTVMYNSAIYSPHRYDSEGEDMECEWNGDKYHEVHLAITTASGLRKPKAETIIR